MEIKVKNEIIIEFGDQNIKMTKQEALILRDHLNDILCSGNNQNCSFSTNTPYPYDQTK